jgi:hypothetical protein
MPLLMGVGLNVVALIIMAQHVVRMAIFAAY